jgi:hypothetical protein
VSYVSDGKAELEIEHYLADMKIIELTDRGFKIREVTNEKQGS